MKSVPFNLIFPIAIKKEELEMYYVFKSKTNFVKTSTKKSALSLSQNNTNIIFKSIPGIPNPWFVYRVMPTGDLQQEINSQNPKEFSPSEMREYLEDFFS